MPIQVTKLTSYGLPGMVAGGGAAPLLEALDFSLQLAGRAGQDFDDPQNYQSCQVGDVGIRLTIEVIDQAGDPVDLGTADVLTVKLGKPSGETLDLTGELLNNGADGKLYYITADGDLDEDGVWTIQAKVEVGGQPKSTRVGRFQVFVNVDDA